MREVFSSIPADGFFRNGYEVMTNKQHADARSLHVLVAALTWLVLMNGYSFPETTTCGMTMVSDRLHRHQFNPDLSVNRYSFCYDGISLCTRYCINWENLRLHFYQEQRDSRK